MKTITEIMQRIDENLAVPAGGAWNYRNEKTYIGRKKGPVTED